jgi:fructose-specific phosphotransferase system IIA component
MKICELMREDFIRLDISATTKMEAIHQVAELVRGHEFLENFDAFCGAIEEREQKGSTSLGFGVALPHARTDQVKNMLIAVGRLVEGVQFEGNDPTPVRLIFLVGTPKQMVTEYLRIVGVLARLLRDDDLRAKLIAAPDAETFIRLFSERESATHAPV